jgi:hypothetical protein
MARPWSARCYGVARQREGSRQNSIGGPALTFFLHYAREGADGQAVVCPLLRGSSPTRWVAPKQHRGFVYLICLPYTRARVVFLNSAQPSRGGSQRNRRPPWWPRLDQLSLVKIAPTSLPLRLAT